MNMSLNEMRDKKQSKRDRRTPSDMVKRRREHISMTIGYDLEDLNRGNIDNAIQNISRTRRATRVRSCRYIQEEIDTLPPTRKKRTIALYRELISNSISSGMGTGISRAVDLEDQFWVQPTGGERRALQTPDPFIHKIYFIDDGITWKEYWKKRQAFIDKGNTKEDWYEKYPI